MSIRINSRSEIRIDASPSLGSRRRCPRPELRAVNQLSGSSDLRPTDLRKLRIQRSDALK